jgi:phage shock protein E
MMSSNAPLREQLRKGAVIIDVRTDQEYAGYHVPGAIHIAYDEIIRNAANIIAWDKPIIVYSTYGLRSRLAALRLRRMGARAVEATTCDQLCDIVAPEKTNL